MRVLITGHDGYIGAVLAPILRRAGHDVAGLDAFLFRGCSLGPEPEEIPARRIDLRDVDVDHVRGFDAVIHLAAISNDPLGHLAPERTYEVNHLATVRLAGLAKRAGVERFVFASSCSLYGAASAGDLLTESASFNPLTPYGESKVRAERDLSELADDDFSPVFLRNATVYGFSPRPRLDLVVNDLVASALTTGTVVVKSDGTPWRPLVHVEDVANAALAALRAPREAVHDQAFNIGRSDGNYQVRDIAGLVGESVGGSEVVYAEDGGPDPRSYRVDFAKAEANLPGFRSSWTLGEGICELIEAFRRHGLAAADLTGPRFIRLRQIQFLQASGRVGADLRWIPALRTRRSRETSHR